MTDLKLWLIEQDVNNGYDTYDSAVVVAADEESARDTHPAMYVDGSTTRQAENGKRYSLWASFENVRATYLGEARVGMPAGVVCASFNAG